jgi:hypothetical protein
MQRGQSLLPDNAPLLKRIPHRSQWNISPPNWHRTFSLVPV